MDAIGFPEFLFFAAATVLVLFGKNIPKLLRSIILNKKQFSEHRSQVARPVKLIDYTGELKKLYRS